MSSIEDLPNEILIQIFSSLSATDILSSVEHVSRRWKEACHTIDTWRNLLYQPGNRLNNDEIIKEVQRIPKLQALLLQHVFENDFFTAVMSKCQYLRTLILTKCAVDCAMMQTLSLNCPNIEQLQIPIYASDNLCMEEVARLAYLKTLVLTAIPEDHIIALKPLADGCPSLEKIGFGTLRILKEDLVYFLERKGGTLQELQVHCEGVGECVLPLLSECNKLKYLQIVCHCTDTDAVDKQLMNYDSEEDWEDDSMDNAVEHPLNLQNLETVTSLSLYSSNGLYGYNRFHIMGMKLFRSHSLSRLVSLNIHLECHYKVFIDLVAMNCPLLKRLHFVRCFTLTDYCLMNLKSLRLLEDVSLEGSRISKAVSMSYLGRCHSLKYLNLTQCHNLAGGAMRQIVTLRNLKRLILDECDVRGFPFDLVPDHIKNLTYISLYNCMHIDWKGIEKLKEKTRLVTIVHEPLLKSVCRCGYCPLMVLGKFPLECKVPCNYY